MIKLTHESVGSKCLDGNDRVWNIIAETKHNCFIGEALNYEVMADMYENLISNYQNHLELWDKDKTESLLQEYEQLQDKGGE